MFDGFIHHEVMTGSPPEITEDSLDRVENPVLVRAIWRDWAQDVRLG